MDTASRYEVVDTIATGDFATVYRARDRDLGREVAIKQIHQHFLANEQQLANYWREAQLLAQLQHPNVLTIYDIVRPRGWLILELMQGNLAPGPQGDPIDLDYLRVVLAGCLNALLFLHGNGVVHGDVKPSNMLTDKQKRVKLGDFGLARRASSEEGSLLKGTTKYMAPELVSNAFGAVGPASDLYSLGFSAYELMCGGQFETLFPGLDSFGRDKQIAWMMWHAAADRRLPAINRVLEGVPEDLGTVIQRLVAKEQSHRYQSADAVLRDLRHDPLQITVPDAPDMEPDPAAAAEAKKKKQMRLVAIVALCFSVMVCIAMLLPSKKENKPEVVKQESISGTVRNIYLEERNFVLEQEDGRPDTIKCDKGDLILINGKFRLLRDLRSGDRVVAHRRMLIDEGFLAGVAERHGDAAAKGFTEVAGQRITVVFASRPDVNSGRIAEVAPKESEFILAFREKDKKEDTQLKIVVPTGLLIVFNEKEDLKGQKVTIKDLKVDDKVVVEHKGTDKGRTATKLKVERVLTVEGFIRDVDAAKGQLTVALGEEPDAPILSLPAAADDCEISLNGMKSVANQLLKLADLKPGDEASIAYDTRIVSVDARRTVGDVGVIDSVPPGQGTINVIRKDEDQPTVYVARPPCEITLGGEPVGLADLRKGDSVDITHDQLGVASPVAKSVMARREPDQTRRAILIGNQNFEDRTVSPLSTPRADVALLQRALTNRYKVPSDNVRVLRDASLVRLQQAIPGYLGNVKVTDSILIYVSGHAYRDSEGIVYLAPKNFNLQRMNTTGLPLQWLVDRFEECPSKKKLLLLDCSHAGDGADLAMQPSTAEMMQTLKTPVGRAPLRTVTAIVSCSPGQRGLILSDKKTSLFPWLLAGAYSGAADTNLDIWLEPTELSAYLKAVMPGQARRLGGVQNARLFLPDNRPPRLSEEAKRAIRQLAGFLRQDPIDPAAAEAQFMAASRLAGTELEPRLLYGLVLMKAKQGETTLKHLEALKIDRPDLLLPTQGIAWLSFTSRKYKAGTSGLVELIAAIPPKPGQAYSRDTRAAIYWAGQLREFAGECPQEGYRPTPQMLARLDAAVKSLGADAEDFYGKGRAVTRNIIVKFDKEAAGTNDPALQGKIKVERRQLKNYIDTFPFDLKAREVLGGLDR